MRYKAWRSQADKNLNVICRDREFENLPLRIRSLGPWQGGREGDINDLKLQYRLQIEQQGFAIVYQPIGVFSPEAPRRI